MSYRVIKETKNGVGLRLLNNIEGDPRTLYIMRFHKKESGQPVFCVKMGILKMDDQHKFYVDFGPVEVWLEPYQVKRYAERLIKLCDEG